MPDESREDLLEEIQAWTPRTRNTFVQRIEGKVSEEGGTSFVREKVTGIAPDMTPRETTLVSSRLCDCGALISAKNQLAARAECCGAYVCEACIVRCTRCGRALCGRHAADYEDDEVLCSRCKPWHYIRIALGLGKEGVKKWFGIS